MDEESRFTLYRVILPVTNIDRAAEFYGHILGTKGIRVSEGRHYFNLGGTVLACYDPNADGDDKGEGWRHHANQYIYISTSVLRTVFDELSSKQLVDSSIETMPWGETLFYAKDPFGNPICFVQEGTEFKG